jgi:hypothetical protein
MLVIVVPLSYHFFEKPLLAMKERFRGKAAGARSCVLCARADNRGVLRV